LGIFWFLRDPFREIELALSIFLLRDIKTAPYKKSDYI